MNSGKPFDQEDLLGCSMDIFHNTSGIAACKKKIKIKNQMLMRFENCESCAPLIEVNLTG